MKAGTIINCGLMALCVGAASAQIDPGPDAIGVYFDTDATHVRTRSTQSPCSHTWTSQS